MLEELHLNKDLTNEPIVRSGLYAWDVFNNGIFGSNAQFEHDLARVGQYAGLTSSKTDLLRQLVVDSRAIQTDHNVKYDTDARGAHFLYYKRCGGPGSMEVEIFPREDKTPVLRGDLDHRTRITTLTTQFNEDVVRHSVGINDSSAPTKWLNFLVTSERIALDNIMYFVWKGFYPGRKPARVSSFELTEDSSIHNFSFESVVTTFDGEMPDNKVRFEQSYRFMKHFEQNGEQRYVYVTSSKARDREIPRGGIPVLQGALMSILSGSW